MEDVSGEGFVPVDGDFGPLVSPGALKLHTYAVLVSIEVGVIGYISDEYLNAISVETTVTALELTLAGLWTRDQDGYRVSDIEVFRVAREVRRQLTALEALRSAH